jgi:hypothetical protein
MFFCFYLIVYTHLIYTSSIDFTVDKINIPWEAVMKLMALFLSIPLLFLSCSTMGPAGNTVEGTQSLNVRIATGSSPEFKNEFDHAVVIVSGSDFDSIIQPMTLTNDTLKATIEKVPLGKNRFFAINVFNKEQVLSYCGSRSADILNSTNCVSINIKRTQGTVIINGTITDDSDTSSADTSHADTNYVEILKYTFDNDSNNLIVDKSGQGLNAVVHGSMNFIQTPEGKGLQFTGSQYIQAGNWNGLPSYSDIKIEIDFKFVSQYNDGTASGDVLSELINDSYWYPTRGFVLRIRNSKPQFAIGTSGSWIYDTDTTTIKPNVWYHIVAIIDKQSKSISIQTNSGKVFTQSFAGTTYNTSDIGYLRIGACSVDPASRFFNGTIDNISIAVKE